MDDREEIATHPSELPVWLRKRLAGAYETFVFEKPDDQFANDELFQRDLKITALLSVLLRSEAVSNEQAIQYTKVYDDLDRYYETDIEEETARKAIKRLEQRGILATERDTQEKQHKRVWLRDCPIKTIPESVNTPEHAVQPQRASDQSTPLAATHGGSLEETATPEDESEPLATSEIGTGNDPAKPLLEVASTSGSRWPTLNITGQNEYLEGGVDAFIAGGFVFIGSLVLFVLNPVLSGLLLAFAVWWMLLGLSACGVGIAKSQSSLPIP